MYDYVALEISLTHFSEDHYHAELRYSQPDANTDRAPAGGMIRLSPGDFEAHAQDETAYGQALSDALFGVEALSEELKAALAAAQTLDRWLRVRLFVQTDALELHRLRWETLRDPAARGRWLLLNERVLFSRMVGGTGLDDVRLRPKADLRALVVVANPAALADPQRPWEVDDAAARRRLAPIAVAAELERAHQGLRDIPIDVLVSDPDAPVRVTPAAIDAKLRARPYDILYLVCHGALWRDEIGVLQPRLYLEQDDGRVQVAAGADLVERLRSLNDRPRLVVLASCQSAGNGADAALGDRGALAALGPQLAAVGIPAVLAMQGNVRMSTIAAFMPTFFDQLAKHGEVDRAAAAARSVVRAQPDRWMPVLYSRLRHGRIWYVPGFTGAEAFKCWPNAISSITEGKCTPVLGFGLLAPLLGSQQMIARNWAAAAGFPMQPERAAELPSVAQYLAISQSTGAAFATLTKYLRKQVFARYQADLAGVGISSDATPLGQMIGALGALRRRADPDEPHAVLARLRLPIYVTANPDSQLADALAEQGRPAVVEFCRWMNELQKSNLPASIYETEKSYRPSPERPLVYHLFGRLEYPESLVLTEDDYFDYLMWVNRNDAIPTAVTAAWSSNALLFLGLTMDDWGFRVLLRSVLNDERRRFPRRFKSVAVQISPNDGYRDPDLARLYLEQYFGGAAIETFWGDVGDFAVELSRHWQQETEG